MRSGILNQTMTKWVSRSGELLLSLAIKVRVHKVKWDNDPMVHNIHNVMKGLEIIKAVVSIIMAMIIYFNL